MKLRLAAAAVVALAVTGVSAPSALGANIVAVPERACYREGEVIRLFGTGFQPGQTVALSIDGQQRDTGPANAAGGVAAVLGLATIPNSEQARAVSMTQTTNPALTVTKAFTQTEVYVVTKPSRFRPGRRLSIRAGGFYDAGPTLYGHVRGPKRRDLRIGGITGPCGKVSATKKVILKKGDRGGTYRVQFDTLRRFAGLRTRSAPVCGAMPPGPFCVMGYRIRRILRLSRASSFSSPVFGSRVTRTPDVAYFR